MASSSTAGWTWDTNREEYFYWSAPDACWIYSSGTRVYPDAQTAHTAAEQASNTPRHSGPSLTSPDDRIANQTSGSYALSYALDALSLSTTDPAPVAQASFGINRDHVRRIVEAPPNVPRESITDPGLLQERKYAWKKLKGSAEEEREQLDSRYRIRGRARHFFVIGKVFRMLWPELAGDADGYTIHSGHHGQSIYTKIRWFVVIRPGMYDCACLPLQTYHGRGVAKKNLRKNDHAIIYTGAKAPKPAKGEIPTSHNEPGMRPPIRVVGKERGAKMDAMSRVNYRKIYTVENNVKVFEFGDVHSEDLESLVSNFNSVWQFEPQPLDQTPPNEHTAQGDCVTEGEGQGEEYENKDERESDRKGGYEYKEEGPADGEKVKDEISTTVSSISVPAPSLIPRSEHKEGLHPPKQTGSDHASLAPPGGVKSHNQPTDSGYASLTPPGGIDSNDLLNVNCNVEEQAKAHAIQLPALGSINEDESSPAIVKAEAHEARTVYSAASSLLGAQKTDDIHDFANKLLNDLCPDDLDVGVFDKLIKHLPDFLRTFALRFGNSAESKVNFEVMYFVHRHRREIVEAVNEGYLIRLCPDDMSSRSDSPVPWQDRLNAWKFDTEFEPPPEQVIDESLSYEDEEQPRHSASDYVGLISKSPAYKWLLNRLQREFLLSRATPDVMGTIRSRIINSLSSAYTISRRRSPSTFRATYEMVWNPTAFVQGHSTAEQANAAMELAVTVTGSENDAQVITCVEYLRQIWPSHGEHTLQLIKLAVYTEPGRTVQLTLPDSTEISALFSNSIFTLEAVGTMDSVADVGEQLAWLGSALTPYCDDDLVCCMPSINTRGPDDSSKFRIKFALDPLDVSQLSSGHCLLQMSTKPVMILGYPIPVEVHPTLEPEATGSSTESHKISGSSVSSEDQNPPGPTTGSASDVSSGYIVNYEQIGIDPDERLLHPERWLSRLERLELEVFQTSKLQEIVSKPLELWGDAYCLHVLRNVVLSLERMHDARYSDRQLTILVEDRERVGVASMKSISKPDVEQLIQALSSAQSIRGATHAVFRGFLDRLGLPCPENTAKLINMSVRILDMATISFVGGHVEGFPSKYLSVTQPEYALSEDLALRKRPLGCLAQMLDGEKVWVFGRPCQNQTSIKDTPLWISTGVEDLVLTWGQAWRVMDVDVPTVTKRIGIGNGFIVRHTGLDHPIPEIGEIVSHWTDDEEDYLCRPSLSNKISGWKLLIGSIDQIITKKHDCPAAPDQFTRCMKECQRLSEVLTPEVVVKGENVLVAQIGGSYGSLGIQHKIGRRVKTSFRKSLLYEWELGYGSPWLLRHRFGVDISDCTGNARKTTLLQALGSSTMRCYLRSIAFEWPVGCEDVYFSKLNEVDENAFPNLFEQDTVHRPAHTKAVYLSLRVLLKTKLDDYNCLTSLWAPPNSKRLYMVKYPSRDCAWNRFLADSEGRFTVSITSRSCLEFDSGSWKIVCRSAQSSPPLSHCTVLETKLDINESIPRPQQQHSPILDKATSNPPLTPANTGKTFAESDAFDLGHGSLVVLQVLNPSSPTGLVVAWNMPVTGVLRRGTETVRRRILHKTPAKRHWEADWEAPDPVPIFVLSKGRIPVSP